MKFNKFNQYGIFVKVSTNIYNKNTLGFVNITTIWNYENDRTFHFITAIPKKWEE